MANEKEADEKGKIMSQTWEVWASEPLTKDAELMVKWSKTSFYEGCIPPEPKVIEGKEFIIYHRCNSEAWARERFTHARQYFKDVRLWMNGKQVEISINNPLKPEDDMLGAYSKLGVRGGGC